MRLNLFSHYSSLTPTEIRLHNSKQLYAKNDRITRRNIEPFKLKILVEIIEKL